MENPNQITLQLLYGIIQQQRKHQEEIDTFLKDNKIVLAYESNKHVHDFNEWALSQLFKVAEQVNIKINTFSYKKEDDLTEEGECNG